MVSIKNVDDIEGINLEEGVKNIEKKVLVGKEDGSPNFITRLFTIGPNGFSEHHTHDWEHEVFILNGEGILKSENKDCKISEGDCIYIPPNEEHQIQNPHNRDLKFICIIPVLD